MSTKRKILIQLDTDPQPSVFDRIVAIDAGAEEVFGYGNVKEEQVRDLIHGAIFTRGPADLAHTAIFIGGSDVVAGERLLAEAKKHLLPQFNLQVSILLDPNGANTTAAAAVRAASKHLDLATTKALVLGGTGPVGQRVAYLLARHGAHVRLGSRQQEKASQACQRIVAKVASAQLEPMGTADAKVVEKALVGCDLVIAAGAAGVVLLPKAIWQAASQLRVAIDLNAVPPVGIEGIEVMAKGTEMGQVTCYGALAVGGIKMKTHKAAVVKLFKANNQIFDVDEVYETSAAASS